MGLKIAFITDAWYPQINGVVTTIENTCKALNNGGDDVFLITPDRFYTIPCPSYPSIKLAIFCYPKVRRLLNEFAPDRIHIATEGPLGLAARKYCLKYKLAFSTSFHTLFAEYINLRFGMPVALGYRFLRWFHKPASHIMIATARVEANLVNRGFDKAQCVRWSRGVDVDRFRPRDKNFISYRRPISLYVGRVAIEKNLHAFLNLPVSGTKIVVGDGPQLHKLKKQFPDVVFTGFQTGEHLAKTMAAADVFVFPSRTDTFGIVMLDALACGVPVAAYPVQGPIDILINNKTGCMQEDLQQAFYGALALHSEDCRQQALGYSWQNCSAQFLNNLVPVT
ncbi:glycosyltransferase family 4 protein [Crenothrix polyspora]|uniref:GDP-mannose-dependent alpha-mannosyltransferase MgtA n=1 Tax=Crenothrix polyspora TaxID=360316 RepID=A0A1R4HI33_9GAMM|nr:glycosyltransferase family 1 protein [Crenothrix polyspora]SJM95896.1 GDP-mannose-dependent alpha-mannosyltransferase MgtA [Crenothrix polyspora]